MLTQQQLASYRENGYVLVKGLFDPAEAKEYRDECHALARRLGPDLAADKTWSSARTTAGARKPTSITHCPDVQHYSAAFTRLLLDDRFTSIAGDVVGSENVALHHTKMFIKPPGKGSPFPLHQDYPFFPHRQDTVAAAIVHFDDAPVERGCVRVVPGSHRWGPLAHQSAGGDFFLSPQEYPFDSAVPCPAEAGDAIFFGYLTVHGSGVNVSNEARTTVLVQFRDAADEPTEAVHLSRGRGMMLRGIDPKRATWTDEG